MSIDTDVTTLLGDLPDEHLRPLLRLLIMFLGGVDAQAYAKFLGPQLRAYHDSYVNLREEGGKTPDTTEAALDKLPEIAGFLDKLPMHPEMMGFATISTELLAVLCTVTALSTVTQENAPEEHAAAVAAANLDNHQVLHTIAAMIMNKIADESVTVPDKTKIAFLDKCNRTLSELAGQAAPPTMSSQA